MHFDEQEHPDYLYDKKEFHKISLGGNLALEDLALAAYFKVLENGGTKEQAEQEYFKTFSNEVKRT